MLAEPTYFVFGLITVININALYNVLRHNVLLQSHIKAEVEFTGRADWVWRDPQTANYDGWIVWRIFVTNSGVLRIYPGTSFRTFNPNLQEWLVYMVSLINLICTVFIVYD